MLDRKFILQTLLRFQYLPNSALKDLSEKQFDSLVDSYFFVLKDLPRQMVEAAASAYLATGRFFPAPGDLRNKAVDIALLAMDVPTEGEAWGIINQEPLLTSVRCLHGIELQQEAEHETGNAYWAAVAAYGKHVEECPMCRDEKGFNWPASVKSAFDALGGTRAIFTDNPAADRARFTDNYRRYIEKEVLRLSMPEDVRKYIETEKTNVKEIEAGVSQVVMQLTNPNTGEKERLE